MIIGVLALESGNTVAPSHSMGRERTRHRHHDGAWEFRIDDKVPGVKRSAQVRYQIAHVHMTLRLFLIRIRLQIRSSLAVAFTWRSKDPWAPLESGSSLFTQSDVCFLPRLERKLDNCALRIYNWMFHKYYRTMSWMWHR
jgi:hypothetical protein